MAPLQTPGYSSFLIRLLIAGVPAFAVIILYSRALFNGFVWDDGVTLPHLAHLGSDALQALVVAGSTLFSHNYFRPLPALISILEAKSFDFFPVYFHLVNVLIHATNTVLAYLVARQIFLADSPRGYALSLLIALFYGLHPALVEPVVWISGGVDLLVVFFLLAALWFDGLKAFPRARIVGVCLFYLLALLSKEMAITFPVLLVLWHQTICQEPAQSFIEWWRGSHIRLHLKLYIGICATTLVYFALRFVVLGHILSTKGASAKGISNLSDRVWLVGASYAKFFEALTGPFTDQRPMHLLTLPIGPMSNNAWLGLLLLAGIIFVLFSKNVRFTRLGWLWLMVPVSLLPISNFIPIQTGPGFFAERFLALPLFFVSTAVVVSAEYFVLNVARPHRGVRVICCGIAGIWLVLCAIKVMQQIPRWQNDQELWKWTIQTEPRSGYAYLQYIDTLKRQGNVDAGVQACLDGLRSAEPEYQADIRRNLGFFYLEMNKFPEAIAELQAARKLYQDGNQNGIRFYGINMFGERQASGNPEYVIAINLGIAYSKVGDSTKALDEFENARQMEPQEPNAYYNLGEHHFEHGHFENASQYFEKALALYKEALPGQGNKALANLHIQDTQRKIQLVKDRIAKKSQ